MNCVLKHHMGITVRLSKVFGKQKKTITIFVLQMRKLRYQMSQDIPTLAQITKQLSFSEFSILMDQYLHFLIPGENGIKC